MSYLVLIISTNIRPVRRQRRLSSYFEVWYTGGLFPAVWGSSGMMSRAITPHIFWYPITDHAIYDDMGHTRYRDIVYLVYRERKLWGEISRYRIPSILLLIPNACIQWHKTRFWYSDTTYYQYVLYTLQAPSAVVCVSFSAAEKKKYEKNEFISGSIWNGQKRHLNIWSKSNSVEALEKNNRRIPDGAFLSWPRRSTGRGRLTGFNT